MSSCTGEPVSITPVDADATVVIASESLGDGYAQTEWTGSSADDTLGQTILCATGVKSEPGFVIQLYPNPTTDQIRISAAKRFESIAVFDMQGRKAFEMSFAPVWSKFISFGSLSPGNYVVVTRGMGWEEERVVIVQR